MIVASAARSARASRPAAFAARTRGSTATRPVPRRRSGPTGRSARMRSAQAGRRDRRPRRSEPTGATIAVAAARPSAAACTSGSARRAAIRTARTARSSSRSGGPRTAATTRARAPRSARRAAASCGPPGHCVYDPGILGARASRPTGSSCPAYNGRAQALRRMAGDRAWPRPANGRARRRSSGGDSAFDFGAATVAPARRKAASRSGSARGGLPSTSPATRCTAAFGYPAEQPAPRVRRPPPVPVPVPVSAAPTPASARPAPIRISCDMTAGASGGGWVIRRDDRGYVASVTSYGYSERPRRHLYGPYQGDVARELPRAAGGPARRSPAPRSASGSPAAPPRPP